jgi:hypothetical protein
LLWLSLAWRGQWTAAPCGVARCRDRPRACWCGHKTLVFAILPLALAGSTVRGRQGARLLAVFVVALGVATLPQWLAWKAVYGELTVPQGSGFLRFSPANPLRVLFHTRHGLCVWSPVVGLAIAGLVRLVRDAATRTLGIAALAVLGLECLLNALPVDWWAGWSFGARRFVDACRSSRSGSRPGPGSDAVRASPSGSAIAAGLGALAAGRDPGPERRSRSRLECVVGERLLRILAAPARRGSSTGSRPPGPSCRSSAVRKQRRPISKWTRAASSPSSTRPGPPASSRRGALGVGAGRKGVSGLEPCPG